MPVVAVVSPKTCSRCHPDEVTQYNRSKHAHTNEIIWKIDLWIKDGMNNAVERASGCYVCHGSVVKMINGKPDPMTWPNVGVGRLNPGWQPRQLHQLPYPPPLFHHGCPEARGLRPVPLRAGSSPDGNLQGIQTR